MDAKYGGLTPEQQLDLIYSVIGTDPDDDTTPRRKPQDWLKRDVDRLNDSSVTPWGFAAEAVEALQKAVQTRPPDARLEAWAQTCIQNRIRDSLRERRCAPDRRITAIVGFRGAARVGEARKSPYKGWECLRPEDIGASGRPIGGFWVPRRKDAKAWLEGECGATDVRDSRSSVARIEDVFGFKYGPEGAPVFDLASSCGKGDGYDGGADEPDRSAFNAVYRAKDMRGSDQVHWDAKEDGIDRRGKAARAYRVLDQLKRDRDRNLILARFGCPPFKHEHSDAELAKLLGYESANTACQAVNRAIEDARALAAKVDPPWVFAPHRPRNFWEVFEGDELSPRQEAVAEAYAAGLSIRAIATKKRMNPSNVKWIITLAKKLGKIDTKPVTSEASQYVEGNRGVSHLDGPPEKDSQSQQIDSI